MFSSYFLRWTIWKAQTFKVVVLKETVSENVVAWCDSMENRIKSVTERD